MKELARSDDVIHMKSKDAIDHIVHAVELEHAEGVVLLVGQARGHVEATIQGMLEESNLLGDGSIGRLIPLFGGSDISERRLGHLHDLVLKESNHLLQQASHVCRGLPVQVDLVVDVVRLQECRFDIHCPNLPS